MRSLFVIALTILFSSSVIATPISYGESTHSYKRWQQLADATTGTAYGITWSTDNGNAWGRDGELWVGQSVIFRFAVHKNSVGSHYADLFKAWMDVNHNGVFDPQESFAYGEHVLEDFEPDIGGTSPLVPDFYFFSSAIQLTTQYVGDLWIRALVTCSHSVTERDNKPWSAQWSEAYINSYESKILPTGYYYQGETEDVRVSIRTVSSPGNMVLISLLYLFFQSRRSRSKSSNQY